MTKWPLFTHLAVANNHHTKAMISHSRHADPAKLLLSQSWPSVAKTACERLRPITLPGAVGALGLNMDDVCEVFRYLAGDPEIKKRPYLRTYVDSQMMPSLERKIWQLPLDKSSSFEDWYSRIFTQERSGLILNGSERWALSASQKLARWLQPKLAASDPLRRCLEIVLFVGDYGFTPFGIHRDEPGASVIHFNLGPHAKDIYVFENDAALQTAPTIRDATRYRIAAGDGFVLPANYAHIGDAASFSVDISCKLMVRGDDAALVFLTSSLLDNEQAVVDMDVKDLLLRRLGASSYDEPVGITVEHWMEAARCRAQSNALFVGIPIASRASWDENSVVSLNHPFQPVLFEQHGKLTLFSRGRSFSLADHNDLRAVLQSLSNSGRMRVGDMLECCCTLQNVRALIDFLVTSRGVDVFT